jgi:hypothetical protein
MNMTAKTVLRWMAVPLLLSFWSVIPARAQEFGRVDEITAQGVPYSVFVRAGEPSVQVMVAGSSNAGIYEIGVGTDLSRLLVLSGAATSDTRAKIELMRQEGGSSRVIYESSVRDVLAAPERAPTLQEGDVLVVTTPRERLGLRDALSIISSLSSIAVLIGYVSNAL